MRASTSVAYNNVNANTPFPKEVPHALNPAPGVIVDFTLASAPRGEVTLDVLDASASVVRHLSSAPGKPGSTSR